MIGHFHITMPSLSNDEITEVYNTPASEIFSSNNLTLLSGLSTCICFVFIFTTSYFHLISFSFIYLFFYYL